MQTIPLCAMNSESVDHQVINRQVDPRDHRSMLPDGPPSPPAVAARLPRLHMLHAGYADSSATHVNGHRRPRALAHR
jgi:hypothetical protein